MREREGEEEGRRGRREGEERRGEGGEGRGRRECGTWKHVTQT